MVNRSTCKKSGNVNALFTSIVFSFFAFLLFLGSSAMAQSSPKETYHRILRFDSGILIFKNSVHGRLKGKLVVLKLSHDFSILIKQYCYGRCKGEFIYKKITLKDLKKVRSRRNNKNGMNIAHIYDPVILELNKQGLVKKIIIVRIPE